MEAKDEATAWQGNWEMVGPHHQAALWLPIQEKEVAMTVL